MYRDVVQYLSKGSLVFKDAACTEALLSLSLLAVNVPVLTHGFLQHLTTTVRSLTPASQKQTDYILGDQTHWVVTNHN